LSLKRQGCYMKLKQRALFALYAYNREISLIFLKEKKNALKVLKEYYQTVKALQEQYDDLFHHRQQIFDQAALDFLHFVRYESPLLQDVFKNADDDKVQEFIKVYLAKRAKHQMLKENLAEQLDQQKKTLPENNPEFNVTQEQLNKERRYLKELILRAAKKCSLKDDICVKMQLHRKEINQTIKGRFSPVIRHVMACDYELALNQTRQETMIREMKLMGSYIPNYTSEIEETLSPLLKPNTLLKNISVKVARCA
ncbi:MAG TPA: hypothetical protein VFP93_02870, partial [Gammaproteobacteria bacterium]|nr:hypothetical protein [Gammaproteobacteria bacterium]